MFHPGEIIHAAFPFSDLTSVKRRPCLVLVQCDAPDDFVVAFITSASTRLSARTIPVLPSHPRWAQTGLKQPSLIRVDKLTTLHLSVISGAIGILPDDLMKSVREKVRALFWGNAAEKRWPEGVPNWSRKRSFMDSILPNLINASRRLLRPRFPNEDSLLCSN
jgi:mRNA interferase MazF